MKLYKYIRSQQRVKPAIHSIEKEIGLPESESETVEVLQKFFKSVFVAEGDGPIAQFPDQLVTESESETVEVLQKFFKSVFVAEGDGPIPQFPDQLVQTESLRILISLLKS